MNDKLPNCTGLTFDKAGKIKNHQSHKELKKQGYIIDTCCYPNIAYKGPRFDPSKWFEVLTEKEHVQSETIRKQGKMIEEFKAAIKETHNIKEYTLNAGKRAAKNRDELEAKKWPSSRAFQDGRADMCKELLELIDEY